MDYNDKLKSLREDKNKTIDTFKKLDESEKEELADAKKTIEEKYEVLKEQASNELDKKTSEVYNYAKLIEEKSTLPKEIMYSILELIKVFEGEEYYLEKISYHKDKDSPSKVYETLMILPESLYNNIEDPNYITERYYHHLLKNGIALKLYEDWTLLNMPSDFSFYKADEMGRLIPQISFKGFPYVKSFIDYIINFRIEKNYNSSLSSGMLESLLEDFALLNIDNISNNYELKKQQKIKESSDLITADYELKKKVLKRIANRIQNEK